MNREPNHRPTPHRKLKPRFTPRALNPTLSSDLQRFTQLGNQVRNWERFPLGLDNRFQALADDIAIPLKTGDFYQTVKNAVRASVQRYLEVQLETVSCRIYSGELTGEQIDDAVRIADGRLAERFKDRKLSAARRLLSEARSLANRANTQTDTTNNQPQTHQTQPSNQQTQQAIKQTQPDKQNTQTHIVAKQIRLDCAEISSEISSDMSFNTRRSMQHVATVAEGIIEDHEEAELQEAMEASLREAAAVTGSENTKNKTPNLSKFGKAIELPSPVVSVNNRFDPLTNTEEMSTPTRKRAHFNVDTDSEGSNEKIQKSPRIILNKIKTPKKATNYINTQSTATPILIASSPPKNISACSENTQSLGAKKQLAFKGPLRGARGINNPIATWTVSSQMVPGRAEEFKGGKDIDLVIHKDTRTLVIGGSNLRDVERSDVPDSWQIVCIPGANLSYAKKVMEAFPKDFHLTNVILTVGINERDNENTPDVEGCFAALEQINADKHFYMGVSVQDGTWPKSDLINIDYINTQGLIRFGDMYIKPVDYCVFRDAGHHHYDALTLHNIMVRMTDTVNPFL